jgi:hypothetical protein
MFQAPTLEMRLIDIECQLNGMIIVNTDRICDMIQHNGKIVITTVDNKMIHTTFTEFDRVVDYILNVSASSALQ